VIKPFSITLVNAKQSKTKLLYMRFFNLILGFIIISMSLVAQPTVGLIQHDDASLDDGYVLFSPLSSKNIYLIDKCGQQMKTWSSLYNPGQSVYLLSDGTILRPGKIGNTAFTAGGNGGIIEKIDWDGNVIWSYVISDGDQCQHHDIKQMNNGNILLISWERKSNAEAIASGRNPSLTGTSVWSEKVLEIQPIGNNQANIVWEWHAWDHLVQDFDATKNNYGNVATSPELINANYRALLNTEDWLHLNSIDYNESLDQILLSSHSFSEIWIIDHSTTTVEAASHSGGNSSKGGDLLYRWGNPFAYNQTGASRFFWGQHDAYWIPEGMPYQNQIMVFNNGNGRAGGNYSTVEVIDPPVTGYTYTQSLPFAPAVQSWIYNAGNTNGFYAQNISGAQQLLNGNVLICDGPAGRFSEVNSDGIMVWDYINPVGGTGIVAQGNNPIGNLSFRCNYYSSSFIGFDNHELIPGATIENSNTVTASCSIALLNTELPDVRSLVVFPNPTKNAFTVEGLDFMNITNVQIVSVLGKVVYSGAIYPGSSSFSFMTEELNSGVYFIKFYSQIRSETLRIVVNK
jgi:hypothetical protein